MNEEDAARVIVSTGFIAAMIVTFFVFAAIDEKASADLVEDKATAVFEEKFLYTPKPVCIGIITGREPVVLPAEECNK